MAAGKHGSSEITIKWDDSLGAPQTITCGVLTLGPIKTNANVQAATTFCDTVEKQLLTGMLKIDDVKLTGFFDDTPTTGSYPLFAKLDTSPQAATRTLEVGFGNGVKFTAEGYQKDFAMIANQGNLTSFEATIALNSGAWTP